MATYRIGNHWGVTIVREAEPGSLFGLDAGPAYKHGGGCLWPNDTCVGHGDGERGDDQLVAVVTNGDRALAERICALLNADDGTADVIRNLATVREAAEGLTADYAGGTAANGYKLAIGTLADVALRTGSPAARWAAEYLDTDPDKRAPFVADSCTCPKTLSGAVAMPDPDCVVHQGRRARGPKPPPLGPGCICDGSGRTCPRHGAVM